MSKTIFIVEDDPIQQKVLRQHFENMVDGFQVTTFANPDDMMSHLHEAPLAIVLDHYFGSPVSKTGLEYIQPIRKKNSNIAIIYYTASEDTAIRDEALKRGAAHYIYKDNASFVRLRSALDLVNEEKSKGGFFKRLFGSK